MSPGRYKWRPRPRRARDADARRTAQHHEKEVLRSDSDGRDVVLDDLEWTEAEETRIRHKIDWHCVPLVTWLYMLCVSQPRAAAVFGWYTDSRPARPQFLDRANIGNARIQGMATDLKLEGIKFNMALSIFYIIYLLVEVPSNIILKKVGPRYYLPLLVCGFGLISMCTAFVQSYEGLLGARAMLGVFEGGAMPGMAFFLSCFYKRKELLFRIGIYVSAASIAGAFGGLLATGLSRIPEWGTESMRINTWRNIFFFEGIITIISGLLAPIWMPTAPETAYFLTERERRIATERLVREQKASPNENVTFKHFKQAVFCIHNYTCAFGFFLINITVQGLSVFMPTILNDLGWTNTQAQLYSVPPYVCACIIAIAIAYVSDKTNRRGIYLAIFAVLAVIGFAVLRWETSANIRYMAVFFVTIGAFPGGPAYLSWAMNSKLLFRGTARTRELTSTLRLCRPGRPSRDQRLRRDSGHHWRHRRNVRTSLLGLLSADAVTDPFSRWTYTTADAPKYFTGHTINLAGQMTVVLLSLFGIFYCSWENKQRAAGKRDHRLQGLTEDEQVHLGSRHPAFRYIL